MVRGVETIGALVRARRKAAGLTQARAAGLAGVGIRFMSELERGKKTLELGLVLEVLERMGFELAIVPRGARLSTPPVTATKASSPGAAVSAPAGASTSTEAESSEVHAKKRPAGRGARSPKRGTHV